MLETTHVLTALALAKNIKNPIIAFGVGLLSHFILDAIPHYDFQGKILKPEYYKDKLVVSCDPPRSCAEGIAKRKKKEFSMTGKIIIWSDLAISLFIFLYLSIFGHLWPDFPDLYSIFLFLLSNFSLVAGVFGGIFPDLLSFICIKTGFCWPRWFFRFHKKIQFLSFKKGSASEPKIGAVIGLLIQFVLCLFCLLIFVK